MDDGIYAMAIAFKREQQFPLQAGCTKWMPVPRHNPIVAQIEATIIDIMKCWCIATNNGFSKKTEHQCGIFRDLDLCHVENTLPEIK